MSYEDARLYVIHDVMGSSIRIDSKSTGRRWESELGQPLNGVISKEVREDLIMGIVSMWRKEDKNRLTLHCQAGVRTRYPMRQRKTREQFLRSCLNMKPGDMIRVNS